MVHHEARWPGTAPCPVPIGQLALQGPAPPQSELGNSPTSGCTSLAWRASVDYLSLARWLKEQVGQVTHGPGS